MACRLFLDTARMGLPSYRALAVQAELSNYWASNGLSVEFDEFLHNGIGLSCSRPHVTALSCWHGVSELRGCLRNLAGLGTAWKTLMAGRSSKLMEVATSIVLKRGKRLMYFSSLWPGYRQHIDSATNAVLFDDGSFTQTAQLVEAASDCFKKNYCHGIVMPSVTHFGRIVPYAEVAKRVAEHRSVDLVVIDGAQEFGQMPLQELPDVPAFYITCTQKWLRSGVPGGIGFVSKGVNWQEVEQAITCADDPLLHFSSGHTAKHAFGETVAVTPMIACRAAIEQLTPDQIIADQLVRIKNRETLLDMLCESQSVSSSRRSGILTLCHEASKHMTPEDIRRSFLDTGVILSAFPEGFIRMSMPENLLSPYDISILETCFARLARVTLTH